jgi:hypothetical protein
LNDDPLPLWLQRMCLICGVGLTTMAIVVFVFPNLLIPYFPWKLTPLTGRSLCGWLIAVGTLMLSVLRENDRTRARLASALLIPILPALLVQMARFSDQVDWSNPVLWAGPVRRDWFLRLAVGPRRLARHLELSRLEFRAIGFYRYCRVTRPNLISTQRRCGSGCISGLRLCNKKSGTF